MELGVVEKLFPDQAGLCVLLKYELARVNYCDQVQKLCALLEPSLNKPQTIIFISTPPPRSTRDAQLIFPFSLRLLIQACHYYFIGHTVWACHLAFF